MWIAPLVTLITLASQDDPALVRGSIALVAGDARIAGTNGVLVVRWSDSCERLVPFRDGRFELRVDFPSSWAAVYSAWTVLGAARIDASFVMRRDWGDLDLDAVPGGSRTLIVLDAETNTPIDCVEVVPGDCVHDTGTHFEALDGAAIEVGPLFGEDLGWPRGDGEWRVRAPGYVEGRARITREGPPTHVLHLERAGVVELRLVNCPSTRHTFLELESAEHELLHRDRNDPRILPRYEGLKPGLVVARVVHEFLDYRRVVLAEVPVEVVAGGVVAAKLAVAKPPPDDTDGPWAPLVPD